MILNLIEDFLEVLMPSPYLGPTLAAPAGQAILFLLSASPHCPTPPSYKAYMRLCYCLGLMEWASVLPRMSFRTLLQFFCIVFHSVAPSKTLDLWYVFCPSVNA